MNPTDELTVLRDFRAERDAPPAAARDAVWRALEARIEATTEESRAFGEAVARTAPRPAVVRRRRGLGAVRRRRVAIFAAAALLAAIATSVIVLRSGPTAQPASAAEILHEAASAAAAADAPTTLVPGPGQYLYREEQLLSIQGWIYPLPAKEGDRGLSISGGLMPGPDAYNVLMPVTRQWWTGPEGEGRYREVAGAPQPLTPTEEARWKAAGSPLPPPFDTEYQQRYKDTAYAEAIQLEEGVLDVKSKGYGSSFHFPDTSMLPTEAPALRQEAEANELDYTGFNHVGGPQPKQLDAIETRNELLNVLQEGNASPPLQAAIFNALSELVGITVISDVTDGADRQGAAIVGREEGGIQWQTIFNPESGEYLATRGILVDPAASRELQDIPAGTVINERVLLADGVVDSIAETPEGGEAPAG
jgi:hypothetical protein